MLLDQNPLWSSALEHLLERINIQIVGKSTSPEGALALIVERKPDLLIADTKAGDSQTEGIACLREARERVPSLRTIVFSGSGERGDIAAAFSAGASAYVRKPRHPLHLTAATRRANIGRGVTGSSRT